MSSPIVQCVWVTGITRPLEEDDTTYFFRKHVFVKNVVIRDWRSGACALILASAHDVTRALALDGQYFRGVNDNRKRSRNGESVLYLLLYWDMRSHLNHSSCPLTPVHMD